MRLSSKAMLLSLAVGLAARAEGPASAAVPTPSPHLAAAQRLYQKLDLDAALAELKEAELAAKDNEDETVQVLIYKGLIYSETGKSGEAQDMFKRALAMRPWAEVPADTSPRLAKSFTEARKSIWGSGGQMKPPPRRRNATPATAAQGSPQAVPATATQAAPAAQPATATQAAPAAQPATATQAAPAAQPAPDSPAK
jgi:tetratricopeptide (TPR) repeat protein